MRRYEIRIYSCLMAFLGVFISVHTSLAQEATLKIGDPAPPLQPYEWVKGAAVTAFDPGMVYVVEMGATWCGPCKVVIPKLTQLAKRYEGKVKVIGVFVQEASRGEINTLEPPYIEKVRRYVENMGDQMDYHVAVDGPGKTIEKQWIDAMGQGRGIPQTFVVDKAGRIAGHFKGIDETSLEAMVVSILEGTYNLEIQFKKSTSTARLSRFDLHKPLFVNGNGGQGDDFIFRSILTRAKGDVRGRPPDVVDGHGWVHVSEELRKKYSMVMGSVQVVNATLADLYYLAYADTLRNWPESRHPVSNEYVDYKDPYWKRSYNDYWHAPILEVSDMLPFDPDNNWHYALKVPDEQGSAAHLQQCMREDLSRYFGYEVSVEIREMPCWFLKVRSGYEAKLTPTRKPGRKYESLRIMQDGEVKILYLNRDMRDFVWELHNMNVRANKNSFPIIDQTGIRGGVDLTFPLIRKDIMSKHDWEGYLQLISDLGLYVERGMKPMKVVVIRDSKSQNQF